MQRELTSLLRRCRLRELVEDVEISLVINLPNYTALLQEVVRDLCANGFTVVIEHDL